jgi:hypothetical protein
VDAAPDRTERELGRSACARGMQTGASVVLEIVLVFKLGLTENKTDLRATNKHTAASDDEAQAATEFHSGFARANAAPRNATSEQPRCWPKPRLEKLR